MPELISAAFLIGLVHLVLSVALVVRAIGWVRLHPLGADGSHRFRDFQVGTLIAGLMLGIPFILGIGLPRLNELMRGDLNAWTIAGLDLLACLFFAPAIGLAKRLRTKANVVALLAILGILPALGILIACASQIARGW